MSPDDTRVGVGVVHDTKSFVEAESLVYERFFYTQEVTNLFCGVAIFRESRNNEFCVVGDSVHQHFNTLLMCTYVNLFEL